MKLEFNHNLGQSQALSKIKNFAQELLNEHKDLIDEVDQDWKDNICNFLIKAKGQKISGVLKVLDDKIELDGKIPMFLKPFQGQIESMIRNELEKLLKG